MQDRSRQDRQLEARAAALDENAQQLNLMIAAVVAMIVLVVVLLYVFDLMKRKKMKNQSMDELLAPLREWSKNNTKKINELKDEQEEVQDNLNVTRLHIEENKKRNLEQRAKISLVNSITPFIDRMIHEVNRLSEGGESDEVRQERYQYIAELTDKINQYNNVLTEWIQMRQGSLNLRIESFPAPAAFRYCSQGQDEFPDAGRKTGSRANRCRGQGRPHPYALHDQYHRR